MRPLTGLLLVVSVVMAQSHFHRRRNTDEILDCSRLVDGNYPNPSERCSHVFVTCDNGQVLTRNCPGTTFYDELIDDCAEKEFVRACGGQLPRVEENKQTPVQEAAHRPVQEAPQPPPAVVTDRPLRKEIVEGSTVEHILFNCAGLRPGTV
uniref:Chitin-binding type-2 domain-containing protein n=1 Tax=Plectus sambesii TaxID=2011161 RepID=A0A914XT71_9BILA